MAAVQQRTPTETDPRKRMAFIESMEEEMRRCSEHLARRQFRRGSYKSRENGFAENSEDAVNRRGRTLPRSFTVNSETELQSSHRSPRNYYGRPAVRSRTLSYDQGVYPEERDIHSYPRMSSAPPEPWPSSSTSSDSYSTPSSSRESSITPQPAHSNKKSRSSRSTPRSSASPPPVAPKPSKHRAYSKQTRRQWADTNSHETELPQVSDMPPTPTTPLNFPSAEISQNEFEVFHDDHKLESTTAVITASQQRNQEHRLQSNGEKPLDEANKHSLVAEPDQPTQPNNSSPATSKHDHKDVVEERAVDSTSADENVQPDSGESPQVTQQQQNENIPHKMSSVQNEECGQEEEAHSRKVANGEAVVPSSVNKPARNVSAGGSEASAPEVKSVPVKTPPATKHRSHRHHSSSSGEKNDREISKLGRKERGKSEPPTTVSESKIHITVSSSVDMSRVVAKETIPTSHSQSNEELLLVVKELQIKLREKEEDIARQQRQHERTVKEKSDEIKKLSKENKKLEREKWELLKRARDAAERSLHLRTQLDMKEGSLRAAQSESERIRDELTSVKSANTSLRALLSDLRATRSSVDQAVQVNLHGSLRRNRSIELAFTQGELSQEQENGGLERASQYRLSTSSLGLPWSDRWEREGSIDQTSSQYYEDSRETTPVPGAMSTSQPISSPDGKRSGKRKLFNRMRRSSGSKRGSVTSIDGLDLRQSSMIQGASRGPTPLGFPYQAVPPDIKDNWRILEENKHTPFNQWTLQAVVAWMDAGIGMTQYIPAVREKVSSGNSLLALSESDMEKKLGISNPLHRRKLKLAIQDQRAPHMCQFPHAGKIDHSWVANEWAQDCGLPHLTEMLTYHLVDGRVLNSLTKDDLRRYFKMSKKQEQISFLSAVELLRMHEFNREAILHHRHGTQNPLYWTNRDVCDWLKDIGLESYANNVIGGGVHGALLFLERGRFTSEHLAGILKISANKSQLRKHLASKLASLFTEDINDSLDPMLSSSPLHLSPHSQHNSPSPDRRHPSPLRIAHSPNLGAGERHKSPPTDCPHPTRKNSLSRSATPYTTKFTTLTQPDPLPPPTFHRTGSQPSVFVSSSPMARHHSQVANAELARRSLRESALRSVSSLHDEALQLRSLTPTVLSSTTV